MLNIFEGSSYSRVMEGTVPRWRRPPSEWGPQYQGIYRWVPRMSEIRGTGVGRVPRGIASAFLPISPIAEGVVSKGDIRVLSHIRDSSLLNVLPENVQTKARGFLNEKITKLRGSLGKGRTVGTLGKIGGVALGLVGPVSLGFRTYSEVLSPQGVSGYERANRFGKILGSEVGFGIGAALGAPLGTIGMMAGGFVGSMIGEEAGGVAVTAGLAPVMAAHAGWSYLEQIGREQLALELGGGISRGNRTEAAATMRQRALLQINKSGINARSILGREASLLHIR